MRPTTCLRKAKSKAGVILMGEPIPEDAPKTQAKPKVTRYICPQCGKVYYTPKALGGHLVVEHSIMPMPPPPPETIDGVLRFSKTWIDDAYKRGFEHGYDEGYAVGRVDGYQKGFREGKEEGYREGYRDGQIDRVPED